MLRGIWCSEGGAVITPAEFFFLSYCSPFNRGKKLEPFLSAPKSDKTDGENQLLHVSVCCFVRLIWTREDYSWMGGWLWRDYDDGNIDFPTLQDHDNQIVDGSHLSVLCKDCKGENV